jgi:formamidopyrimidine-DNA glycosylase
MPELPEVETIAAALRLGGKGHPPLVGKVISGARLLWARTLVAPAPEEFTPRISGEVIHDVSRRGKYILFALTSDTLLIHLRMSGDLLVEPQSLPLAPHHRLVLDLEEGSRLAFNDARKFGRVWLVSDPQTILADLGPEPLSSDFTPMEFYSRLQRYRRQIKSLLLDQTFLAGMGNIYADEALHAAGIHPLLSSHGLSPAQAESLWQGIRQVLMEGIRRNGASIDWVYRGGDFQNYFRVYQRTGKPCPTCGTPIQRIVVGQRGTHFCPVCQALPFGQGE